MTNALKEMIRQGYNNPSIVMWGVHNEVYYTTAVRSFGSDFNFTRDELVAFNKSLVALAKSEDPSRLIVQADVYYTNAVEDSVLWGQDIDLTGINAYFGLGSIGKSGLSATDEGRTTLLNALQEKVDNYLSILGSNQMMLSEYGSGASINYHVELDDDMVVTSNDASYMSFSEEYQTFMHEAYWDFITGSDNIAASFVWNMFEFSCYRSEADTPRLNNKGIVCYDHTTKKDAYYFYRAVWNKSDKFVHLTSKRFTERNKSKQQIKAYSNCEQVELFVNGESKGLGTKQQDGVFVWKDVEMAVGSTNSLRVVAKDGDASYEDSVEGIKINGNGYNAYKTRFYINGEMAKNCKFQDPQTGEWKWANADGSIGSVRVYRLLNPDSKEHLWTIDANEVKVLTTQHGWIQEDDGWDAPKSSQTPVYRLHNQRSGEHHYTTDKNEVDTLVKYNIGWVNEGVKFYSAKKSVGQPIYRVWSGTAVIGCHHYTADKNEYDTLVKQRGWHDERVAWYGLKLS